MAKKKLGNVNIFTGEGMDAAENSFEAADAILYGAIAKVDEGRQVAKPISIFDIQPDAAQPRRAIPSTVRQRWNGNPHTLDDLFSTWLDMAQEEKQAGLDISPWLEGVSEDEDSESEERVPKEATGGSLETALMHIVELAASIKRDGLTNPITVVQGDNGYLLETGERRWLAYHLLYANYRDEKWTKIPARIVDQFNVWRQATENTARADLNAIGKARQYAILMMDLWSRDGAHPKYFRPIEEFPSERAFYAQVSELPVPYGKGKLLLSAIGAQNAAAFTRRRKLLNLPDPVWHLADDRNIAEDFLLTLEDLSPEEALARVRGKTEIFSSRKDSPEQPPKAQAAEPAHPLLSNHNRQNLNRVWKLANRVSSGATNFSDKDLDTLAKMRRWLDEVENMVQSRRQERKK
ncbi:MAG: ParB/RepB/Spo0J family partition protein [Anaerolineae bacterium]